MNCPICEVIRIVTPPLVSGITQKNPDWKYIIAVILASLIATFILVPIFVNMLK